MSMPLWCLVACALHFGLPPGADWRVARVDAPVAEPDVDAALRASVEAALAARRRTDPTAESPPAVRPPPGELVLTVERADWLPAQRDGALIVYQARLLVQVDAAGRRRAVDVRADVLAPATAAEARAVRAAIFRQLADRAAAETVSWLVLGGS